MPHGSSASWRDTRQQRLHIARALTVLGVGVAAIASCQRFRDDMASHTWASREAELTAFDACVARGGYWIIDARTCLEREAVTAPAAPRSPAPAPHAMRETIRR